MKLNGTKIFSSYFAAMSTRMSTYNLTKSPSKSIPSPFLYPLYNFLGTLYQTCCHVIIKYPSLIFFSFASIFRFMYFRLGRHFAFAALARMLFFKTATGPVYICVYIHPALISFRSEYSRLSPAGGISSDRCKHFSSRSHVNIYYKNCYDRHEIAPV